MKDYPHPSFVMCRGENYTQKVRECSLQKWWCINKKTKVFALAQMELWLDKDDVTKVIGLMVSLLDTLPLSLARSGQCALHTEFKGVSSTDWIGTDMWSLVLRMRVNPASVGIISWWGGLFLPMRWCSIWGCRWDIEMWMMWFALPRKGDDFMWWTSPCVGREGVMVHNTKTTSWIKHSVYYTYNI